MPRKVLLVLTLVVCLTAFGQTGANGQSSAAQNLSTPAYPTQAVPIGNGLGWSGGTAGYYGEGPSGGVLLSTPMASFDSPLPAAGISMAGRTGISDSGGLNTGVQGTATTSTLVYTNIAPEMYTGPSPATSAVSSGNTASDFGPSFYSSRIGEAAENTSSPSLAEIADHYKALATTMTVRTYTNADIHPAHTTAADETAILAANHLPSLPQMAATPDTSTSPADTTTQDAAASNTAPSTGGAGELPASGSPLPLLGLMGITSIGLGLLLKGSKREQARRRA